MTFPSARAPFAARSIALFGLVMIFASASFAQGYPVSYMTIPPSVPSASTETLLLPNTTNSITNKFSFLTTLPGYGPVQITWNPTACSPTTSGTTIEWGNQSETFSPSGAAGPNPLNPTYTWGTSANDLNFYNPNSDKFCYSLTFTFLGAAPDPEQLLLVVSGLDNVTTATVSQPGNLVGEWTFTPSNDPLYGKTSSKTCLDGSSQTGCPSSGTVFYSEDNGDSRNTGWALFQATGPIDTMGGLPTLTLMVSQNSGDGIGFTLGYTPTGYIEVCKQSSTTNPLTAKDPTSYFYTVPGSAFSSPPGLKVPVGQCSGPIPVGVPATGTVAITELPAAGVGVDLNATTAVGYSAPPFSTFEPNLVKSTTAPGTVNVMVAPPATAGDTSTETIVTFYNYEAPPAELKICKVAGSGVTVGTRFSFTTMNITLSVEAGPPTEDGYCQVVSGMFEVGTSGTITETVPAGGYAAPTITVNGVPTQPSACTPSSNGFPCSVLASIAAGVNEVSFTNCLPTAATPCPDPPSGQGGLPNLAIVNYSLVSQVASAGTQAYMTYRADLLNTGPTILSPLIARLSSLDPSSVQVAGRGQLSFAAAPANGQVPSSNTFTVLTDPTVPFDFSKLSWAFYSARSVPPRR